ANAVDILAAKLIDNVLDAAAPDTDASADGVDFRVDRGGGDLGSMPRLAGQRLDLDGALADFRHLPLKQPTDQLRVRAAQDDLHGGRCIADFKNQRLHAFPDLVILAGDLLGARHDPLDATQID